MYWAVLLHAQSSIFLEKSWGLLNFRLCKIIPCATQFFSWVLQKNTPEWKMPRPWTRSMPNPPEEVYGTQTSNNFTQGQSSQQDSEVAFSQVWRLFEQSQQQHQEMMNQQRRHNEAMLREQERTRNAQEELLRIEQERERRWNGWCPKEVKIMQRKIK